MKPSSSSSFCPTTFLLSVFAFSFVCNTTASINIPNNETVPAVIVFGDSIVDTGNNNNLRTIVKCDFPPYGKDFKGAIPTGRFCNGKVPADLLGSNTQHTLSHFFLQLFNYVLYPSI